MLAYLVLGVCLLLALLLARSWLLNTDPKVIARVLRYAAFGLLGAIALVLLATGRFMYATPLAILAWILYRGLRLPPIPSAARGPSGPSGRSSKVETAYLRMILEHDSGEMSGEVLKGPFAGKQLSALDLDGLVALLGECHREDPESAQLLETYLDRAVGDDWREAARARTGGEYARTNSEEERVGRGWGRRQAPGGQRAAMSREEAREILGVGPEATADEIKDAYRRLMHKIHPDQGGSTYLAAKINQAKDILLAA